MKIYVCEKLHPNSQTAKEKYENFQVLGFAKSFIAIYLFKYYYIITFVY
jgi:hypothetical protein